MLAFLLIWSLCWLCTHACDDPQRVLVGNCHCATFGCNWQCLCSYDDTQVLTLCVFQSHFLVRHFPALFLCTSLLHIPAIVFSPVFLSPTFSLSVVGSWHTCVVSCALHILSASSSFMQLRQLVPLLTNRDISLIRRGRLYSSCAK